ncbi:GAD-like domain-containing protein, partial [Vibrio metschnikovii]|uniref:GAD-like domain-containing protein n=1 Tax=Vibrio metschnikovii TaxID=28172 RepID=UPI002FC8409D
MSFKFQWTAKMQQGFDEFEHSMGVHRGFPIVSSTPVPAEVLEQYNGVLPENLLAYWERYGWCGLSIKFEVQRSAIISNKTFLRC